MFRTKTLDQMVTMLRAECGESTNASMGINSVEGLYQLIRRKQEELYDEFDWPNKIIDTDHDIVPGENYYTFDDVVDQTRIFGCWVRSTNVWLEMKYGITPIDYNASNPEIGQVNNPPAKWQIRDNNQFEVWPMPGTATKIRFRHVKTLSPMNAGSDMGTLDANLLVLFCAAERLASKKDQGAPLKLQAAQRRLAAMRFNSSKKRVTNSFEPRPSGRILPYEWTVHVPRTS